MSKNRNSSKNPDEIFELIENNAFNSFDTDIVENEMVSEMMRGMVDAGNTQIVSAIELTKIIVNKLSKEMNEDEIIAIFKKASQVISETSPLTELLEKFTLDTHE
ncbi:MAG: hypothetical protein ACK5Z5_04855 [Neisseriaceae bacterium]